LENKKREWIYIHKPDAYDIACDVCGGTHIHWSEYEGKIWCYDCEIDTPGTGGIFDGPVPLNLCMMMGIRFDRIRLSDQKLLKMIKNEDGTLNWVETTDED